MVYTLYCETVCDDSESDWVQYATVSLTPEDAAELLSYRDEWKRAATKNNRLCALEYFDYRAQYGRCEFDTLDESGDPVLKPGYWERFEGALHFSPERTAAETMCVTETGILWKAYLKYGGGQFETEKLDWDTLARIARGDEWEVMNHDD